MKKEPCQTGSVYRRRLGKHLLPTLGTPWLRCMRCVHEASVRPDSRRAATGGFVVVPVPVRQSVPQQRPSSIACLPACLPTQRVCTSVFLFRRHRRRIGWRRAGESSVPLLWRRFSSRGTAAAIDAGGDRAAGGGASSRAAAVHRQRTVVSTTLLFPFLFTSMCPVGLGLI